MRVCELHRERAIETLVSRRDQVEYDLCEQCVEELHHILHGYGEEVLNNGPTDAISEYKQEERRKVGTRRRRTGKTASVAKT